MDVVSGQADVMFNGMLPVMPQVQSGRLRLLAITSAERLPTLPDTPTVAELGMPGFLTGQHDTVESLCGGLGNRRQKLILLRQKGFVQNSTVLRKSSMIFRATLSR
jgi:hypothetical protein